MLLVLMQVLCVMSIGMAEPEIRDWRQIVSNEFLDGYVDINKLNRQYDEYNNTVTINAWTKIIVKDKLRKQYPGISKYNYKEEHNIIYISDKNERKMLIEYTWYDFEDNAVDYKKYSRGEKYIQVSKLDQAINRYITDMVNKGEIRLDDDGWVIKLK